MHDGGGAIGGGAPTPNFDHTPHVSHTPHVDNVPNHHHVPVSDTWGLDGSADPRWIQHETYGRLRSTPRRGTRAQTFVALIALILIFALFFGFAIG